jgi:hypothetical protein
MMAIISKAVFEKEAPKATLGQVLPLSVYRSAHKAFEKLKASGSRLFLVTVRPPDEQLCLVAVLEALSFDGEKWNARPNARAMTDISHLKSVLTFESGKGISAANGQLGMSLQSPRVLTAQDADALLGATGAASTVAFVAAPKGPPNLTAHEPAAVVPCLCRLCLPTAPERASAGGMTFVRSSAEANNRVLHYWVPTELEASLSQLSQSVKSALLARPQRRLTSQ